MQMDVRVLEEGKDHLEGKRFIVDNPEQCRPRAHRRLHQINNSYAVGASHGFLQLITPVTILNKVLAVQAAQQSANATKYVLW